MLPPASEDKGIMGEHVYYSSREMAEPQPKLPVVPIAVGVLLMAIALRFLFARISAWRKRSPILPEHNV